MMADGSRSHGKGFGLRCKRAVASGSSLCGLG